MLRVCGVGVWVSFVACMESRCRVGMGERVKLEEREGKGG